MDSSQALSHKAKQLWNEGKYLDAARNFVSLTEIFPNDALVEESLYWAASLYQYYLQNAAEASRFYIQLTTQFPGGPFHHEALESLAALYEGDKQNRHRALPIYRELLQAPELRQRHDYVQFRIASLYMAMGKMDQARYEFRALLRSYPKSRYRSEGMYLVGYSYYREERFPMAMVAFHQVVRDFPNTPIAERAQYFMADTLEEQGDLRGALKLFEALQTTYHNPTIIEKRIANLNARMRSSVR
ncbi:MAG: tetratricopeptide repeat protein [Candidatus Lambdaproteobacteria bacterium]|nr:tetratricopeptide repeat protein [Candidatus Lambdaproteobacteria bacterium]